MINCSIEQIPYTVKVILNGKQVAIDVTCLEEHLAIIEGYVSMPQIYDAFMCRGFNTYHPSSTYDRSVQQDIETSELNLSDTREDDDSAYGNASSVGVLIGITSGNRGMITNTRLREVGVTFRALNWENNNTYRAIGTEQAINNYLCRYIMEDCGNQYHKKVFNTVFHKDLVTELLCPTYTHPTNRSKVKVSVDYNNHTNVYVTTFADGTTEEVVSGWTSLHMQDDLLKVIDRMDTYIPPTYNATKIIDEVLNGMLVDAGVIDSVDDGFRSSNMFNSFLVAIGFGERTTKRANQSKMVFAVNPAHGGEAFDGKPNWYPALAKDILECVETDEDISSFFKQYIG